MSTELQDLRQTDFIALDLETTGFSSVGDQILEIGAVRFRRDGTIVDQFQQLIDPQREIPWGATEVHGITDEMVVGQPTIDEVLPGFVRFLSTQSAILMAHCAWFDVGFLSVAFNWSRLIPPSQCVIDTCELARRRIQLRNHKLETLGRHLQLIEKERHRALDDALLLKDVFLYLIATEPPIGSSAELYRLSPGISFESQVRNLDKPPIGYEELWEAIAKQQPVVMKYMGGSVPGSMHTITPIAVMQNGDRVYLRALCHACDMTKTYRLDRIASYRKVV